MYTAKSHNFPGFIVLVLRVSSAALLSLFEDQEAEAQRWRSPQLLCWLVVVPEADLGLSWVFWCTCSPLPLPQWTGNSMMCLLCLFIHIWLFISGEWEKRTGVGLRMGWNRRAIINSFSHTNHWNTTYEKQHHQQNAMITQHCFIFGSKEGAVLINRWRQNVYNILLLVMELSSPS